MQAHSSTPLSDLSAAYRPLIEAELKTCISVVQTPGLEEMHAMLIYHMGWEGQGAGVQASGKRIRPILTLLVASATSGGEWRQAIPAAAAVELVHNFSLIHDDIEDHSPLRRGRPTVWNLWGIPQAINAGDALFTLAHLAVFKLERTCSAAVALESARILQATCLHLTQGQYLDMSYENRRDLFISDYWPMVAGKTAALLSACCELGALAGSSLPEVCQVYREFGRNLGLAFQVQDDLLGIWGEPLLTGKSAESDLVSGKKSLPILFGLEQRGQFYDRWLHGPISAGEVIELAALLEAEGAREFAQAEADRLTHQAMSTLGSAAPEGLAGEALLELSNWLLNRKT